MYFYLAYVLTTNYKKGKNRALLFFIWRRVDLYLSIGKSCQCYYPIIIMVVLLSTVKRNLNEGWTKCNFKTCNCHDLLLIDVSKVLTSTLETIFNSFILLKFSMMRYFRFVIDTKPACGLENKEYNKNMWPKISLTTNKVQQKTLHLVN